MVSAARGSAPTDTGPLPDAIGSEPARANSVVVLGFLSLSALAYAALSSLVAPALPLIARNVHASYADTSWVLTAYLLSAAVATPVIGRLGDMFGKKRLLVAVNATLVVGTLVAALAPSLGLLILARVIQGAAGAIFPLSISIVRDELPRDRVSVGVGMLSAIFGIGGGIGVVLAGPIVDHLSWHWLFWFPLMAVAIALIGIAVGISESPVRAPGRVDVLGAVVLAGALVGLLVAVDKGHEWGWSSGRTVGLLVAAVVLLAAWVLIELRVAEPLVDMHTMLLRGVWTTNIIALAFGMAMYGSFLLIPQLLELPSSTGYGFGQSITGAGLFLLVSTMGMVIFGPLSGILESRYGAKLPLVLGSLIGIAAYLLPSLARHETGQILVALALTGIGIGLAFAAMANAIVAAVPPSQTGVATGINTIVRSIGGSIGTAVIAQILASNPGPGGVPSDHAFGLGFGISAAVVAVAFVTAFLVPGRLVRTGPTPDIGR